MAEVMTLDELDSIVAGVQADLANAICENLGAIDSEDYTIDEVFEHWNDHEHFEIDGLEGEWILDSVSDSPHVWRLRSDVDPYYTEGHHVGLVDGACKRECERRRKDIEVVRKLKPSVTACGFEWTLQGGHNYGEPEYVSEVGFVNRPMSFDRGGGDARPWGAGDADGDLYERRWFRSHSDAMAFVVRESKRYCAACGRPLPRSSR